MDKRVLALSSGRAFEKEVFGFTVDWFSSSSVERLGFEEAIQRVIQDNWVRVAEITALGASRIYDPTKPRRGKTGHIWKAVKKHLPEEVDDRESLLSLYVTLGTSLDIHYGIDAFFWWEGVYVTWDLSLKRKTRDAEDPDFSLEADFVVTPKDLEGHGLNKLGLKIATRLIRRRNDVIGITQRISKVRWV